MNPDSIQLAARAIANAEALVVGAGAGMGVDSGLPDFRGNEGFWRAYPPLKKLGLSFVEMANPRWFDRDPSLAWGFYGHRLHLYRDTQPHDGFDLLLEWLNRAPAGGFVFTSNVDGQFQRAGFADTSVVECHGSIHHLQCAGPCCDTIWPATNTTIEVDPATFRARVPLPTCPRCDGVARPNVLLFGDGRWLEQRAMEQESRLDRWLQNMAGRPVTVVELGAGTAVPTVRWTCERLAETPGGTLVRINPREPHGPHGTIGLRMNARAALREIDRALAD